VRFPFLHRVRHPFYRSVKPTPAASVKSDAPAQALYGAVEELAGAAVAGIRVERAVFPVRTLAEPFLSESDRDALWDMFQVPVYALLLDGNGSVIAFECEAQDGLHLKDGCAGVLFGRIELKQCECGRPGPRLMPAAQWESRPEVHSSLAATPA
jgi:hypothetical protein